MEHIYSAKTYVIKAASVFSAAGAG